MPNASSIGSGWYSPLAFQVERYSLTRAGELMRRTLLRLLSSFRSSRAERELAREVRSHLQLLEDQYIANGLAAPH
jgi:hypothetical protein